MRIKMTMGLAALAFAGSTFAASDAPSGYTKCVQNTGATCSMSGTKNVALGKSGSFVYAVKTGSFACSSSNFPSNSYASSAWCSVGSSATASSSSSSVSSSVASGVATLSASGGSGKISLSWSKISSGNIEIYRDTDSNPSGRVRIASVSYSSTSYTDSAVTAGTTYYYWLKYTLNGSTVNTAYASAKASSTSSSSSSAASSSKSSSSSSVAASGSCKAGSTISGTTVDCGGATIGLSCDGDSEKQPAVLTLNNATVKNVRISKTGGSDGIHCTGGTCTLENVVWEDICEDAASIGNSMRGVTMVIKGGSAFNSASSGVGGKPDKIFQNNGRNTTIDVQNFTALGEHGKLARSCGDCTDNGGPRYFKFSGVTVDAKVGSIVGVNRNYGDKATIRSMRIKGYKAGSPKVCEEWKGVQKGSGSSSKYGEYWGTAYCDVSKSDVTAF